MSAYILIKLKLFLDQSLVSLVRYRKPLSAYAILLLLYRILLSDDKAARITIPDRYVPQTSLQAISALVIGIRLCRQRVESLLSHNSKFILEGCLPDPLEYEPKIINKIFSA
jgi:hypothetical protein